MAQKKQAFRSALNVLTKLIIKHSKNEKNEKNVGGSINCYHNDAFLMY